MHLSLSDALQPSIIFSASGAYQSELPYLVPAIIVACKCYNWMGVTDSNKHSSLFRYVINYNRKRLYDEGYKDTNLLRPLIS